MNTHSADNFNYQLSKSTEKFSQDLISELHLDLEQQQKLQQWLHKNKIEIDVKTYPITYLTYDFEPVEILVENYRDIETSTDLGVCHLCNRYFEKNSSIVCFYCLELCCAECGGDSTINCVNAETEEPEEP